MHFILEVGNRAQSPDDSAGFLTAQVVGKQSIETIDFHIADMLGAFPYQVNPFIQAEKSALGDIMDNRDDYFIK